MEKELFQSIIKPIGKFTRQYPGSSSAYGAHEDLKFVPIHNAKSCPNCNLIVKDRQVIIRKKEDVNGKNFLEEKCLVCKAKKKWNEFRF